MVKISLIVIRCTDIEVSKLFYEKLGLHFHKEQHGKGAKHYASVFNGTVFELYPKKNSSTDDDTRLGFKLSDLEQIVKNLEVIQTYMIENNSVYIVLDPDGRKVELS